MSLIPSMDAATLREQAPFLSDDMLAEFHDKGADSYASDVWEILESEIARRAADLKSGAESIDETDLAPAPEGRLVTAFHPTDPTQVVMARVLLDGAGIPFVESGGGVQDLFGAGRLFGGSNMVTGPVRIEVAENHLERAREALASLLG